MREYTHPYENTAYSSQRSSLWNTHLHKDPCLTLPTARDVDDFKSLGENVKEKEC